MAAAGGGKKKGLARRTTQVRERCGAGDAAFRSARNYTGIAIERQRRGPPEIRTGGPRHAIQGSSVGAWRSLVAHTLGVRVVAGSNPAAPTNKLFGKISSFTNISSSGLDRRCLLIVGTHVRDLASKSLRMVACGPSSVAIESPRDLARIWAYRSSIRGLARRASPSFGACQKVLSLKVGKSCKQLSAMRLKHGQ
jgi:hypothetical protein